MVGLRLLIDPILGDQLPLVTLFGAVAISVWLGGWAPAVLSAIAGYLACNYLFIEPRGSLHVLTAPEWIGVIAYLVSCGVIIGFGEQLRRSRLDSQARRDRLHTTLSSIGDAVITTDVDGRVDSMNLVAESLTGWTERDASGRPLQEIFKIINESTREEAPNPAARALREGAVVGLANHTLLVARDGFERPIDDSAAPIRDGKNTVVGCVLVFRDISVRRRLERFSADQAAASRMLASVVESSDDAIVSKSLDGIIESWNAGAQRVFGFSAQEAIGKHISLIIPDDRVQEEADILARLRAGDRVDHFDTVRKKRDGSTVHVSLTISPTRDENGRVVGASKIARDISDRKRIEQALKDADRRKDEFLATLAHELRNPLAPIANMLEVMKRAENDPELLLQARDTMERQLASLVRLVDDLLDVSRISRNKLEMRKQPMDLKTVIHQAVESSRPWIESHDQTLTVTLPDEPVILNADPVRLAQVFINLLNNASKYTEPKGQIWLTAETHDDRVVVKVKDTGAGIPPEKLGSIFEMFTQVDQSLERSHGGLGIGLTLAKTLLELHGGTVRAFSDGPGRGSEFVVELPVLEAVPMEDDRPRPAIPGPKKQRRILVVDDNADSATSLAMLLRVTGDKTFTARDGFEALAEADKHRPDVVLLDIGLPRMNGYDVARRIRENGWGKDMVLIALTGWGQEKDRKESRDAGFDAHLVKPVDYMELTRLLAELSS
jgi:PAS domain S-box-containing protein